MQKTISKQTRIIVAAILLTATFFSLASQTMMVTALPVIQHLMHVTLDTAQWLTTGVYPGNRDRYPPFIQPLREVHEPNRVSRHHRHVYHRNPHGLLGPPVLASSISPPRSGQRKRYLNDVHHDGPDFRFIRRKNGEPLWEFPASSSPRHRQSVPPWRDSSCKSYRGAGYLLLCSP